MPGTNNKLVVHSYEPFGYEGALLSVETDLRRGIPSVDIVGLADGSIRSVRERLIAAFRNQGLEFPSERVLMSLSPADLKKESNCTDLAMAVSILNEQNNYEGKPVLVMGELDVSGTVRPVKGVAAAVQVAKSLDITNIIVPDANMNEALSAGGVKVLPVRNLSEVHEKLLDFEKSFVIESQNEPVSNSVTFDEEKIDELLKRDFNKALEGHYNSARAIEIAIAGKHNILLTGAPGCGKTFLSQSLIPALTPNLTTEEAQSTSRIWSIAGLMKPEEGLKKEIPFRMPHQTASIEGICGGGVNCRPGEMSLAHNGVLFLDEAAEFRSSVLQMMRVPLESKTITLSRAGRTTVYPSNFQLVMATNPCPCGNYGSKNKICLDSVKSIDQYWKKFSSPLLDRVEIKQFVDKDVNDNRKITVEEMKQHILNAMTIQRNNQNYNSNLTPQEIAEKCKLDEKSQKYFDNEFSDKSERSKANSLKLALTIANMDNRTEIEFKDLREAVELNKSIFEKELSFNSEIEPDYNSKSENEHTLSEDEFQDYSVDNEVFKYNSLFNEAVRDSYYDGIAINRIVEYHPEDYGFEKDDKLHLIVEYDNNETSDYEEDGLFNCLNDKHIKFNGKEIDWNPIDIDLHGTIEQYLEHLKTQKLEKTEKYKLKLEKLDKNNQSKFLQKLVEYSLEDNAIELPEVEYTRENYNKYFSRGKIESPVESLKMGENQFKKFGQNDRNNLMKAAYLTLTKPSLIIEKDSYDKVSDTFKPLHVYGKSFYRATNGNKRVVESVIVYKDENNIVIGSHNKDINNFTNQIKTADQIVYVDSEISRMITQLNKEVGNPVSLYGMNTKALNQSYDKNLDVSIIERLPLKENINVLSNKADKNHFSVDLTNTGYLEDGILSIDLSKNDNTEFSITSFDNNNKEVTKKFDFADLFNGKNNNLNILSEPMKVDVNGKERNCEHGIFVGFKNAVEKLDNLTRDYNSLVDNYSILKEQNAVLSNQLASIKENQEKKHDSRDYTA